MKKIKIDMFQEYVSKLIFRCCVFLVVLLAYLFEPDYFDLILTKKGQPGGKTIMFSAHMDHIGLIVTDVEDEVNGLFTYDRAALKPEAAAVRSCNAALAAEFAKATAK